MSFTLARGEHRNVGPDILQHDNPIRISLINRSVQRQRDWAGDDDIVRQGIGHVPQTLDLRRPRHRHLREDIRLPRGGSKFRGRPRWLRSTASPNGTDSTSSIASPAGANPFRFATRWPP